MLEFEGWKNEIIDSILQLHEETKLIREYLEEENEVEENEEEEKNTNANEVEEEQETNEDELLETFDLDNVDENVNDILILEKFDEINESINTLNKSVIEGSIVVSISIILALAFHYFVNQLSKW